MENNALIEIKQINPAVLFSEDDALDALLEGIRRKLDEFPPDISCDAGRKEIASMAHRIARSKTLLDDMRKKHIEEHKGIIDRANLLWRPARDILDAWKEEIRKPLTDWEAEQTRIRTENERLRRELVEARALELAKYGKILSEFAITAMTDEEWDIALSQAKESHAVEQKRLADEEAARKAEAVRLETIRQEQEAEAARLAEQKRTIEAAQAAERAQIEAERRAIEAEKKAMEDAKRAVQERKDREIFEAKAREDARIQAEKDAKDRAAREIREAAEREETERLEKERLEALRPDKKKLLDFAAALMKAKNDLIPELTFGSPLYPLLRDCEVAIDRTIKILIKRVKED